MKKITKSAEARALAQCYALLIRKAQERRVRLARESADLGEEVTLPMEEQTASDNAQSEKPEKSSEKDYDLGSTS